MGDNLDTGNVDVQEEFAEATGTETSAETVTEETTEVPVEETPVEEPVVEDTPVDKTTEEETVDDTTVTDTTEEEETKVPSISAGTITRTVLLFVSLINLVLGAFGMSPLPIDSEQLNALISSVFTIIMAIIAWWKDNDITEKARERKAKIAS